MPRNAHPAPGGACPHALRRRGLALDLRLADDLVADHCGREGFEPAMVREAIRTARWEASKDVWRLVQTCAHPVVHFVLRDDLLARAERVIRRLAQDRDARPHLSEGLLVDLPPQPRADITIGKGRDGRHLVPRASTLRSPARPQPDRELLMGEQLYGDPGLALRELYQNALDACRYRRARVEYLMRQGWPGEAYEGRIAFEQGVEEETGREYIECEDDGVGMTARDPGATCSRWRECASRTCPSTSKEQARWDLSEPPIQLYPNSRFGIGVLSYSCSPTR